MAKVSLPNRRTIFLFTLLYTLTLSCAFGGPLFGSCDSLPKKLGFLNDESLTKLEIERLGKKGESREYLAKFFDRIKQLPESRKQELLNQIANEYPRSSEKNQYPKLSGRRTLDVIINRLLPPKDIIAQRIAEKQTPLEAYYHYLNLVSSALGKGKRGNYSADHVVKIMKTIQDWMRDPKREEIQFVRFFGSFPNGRAHVNSGGKQTSDIDLSGPEMSAEFLRRDRPDHAEAAATQDVYSYLFKFAAERQKLGAEIGEALSTSAFEVTTVSGDIYEKTEVSPIVFDIYRDSIVMKIYPIMPDKVIRPPVVYEFLSH